MRPLVKAFLSAARRLVALGKEKAMNVQDVVQFPEGVGRETVARLVHQGQAVDVNLQLGFAHSALILRRMCG